MTDIKDGGLAFPQFRSTFGRGMSLRDYFAAKALPAVVSAYVKAHGSCIGTEHAERNCTIVAYKFADAMLKAREHP